MSLRATISSDVASVLLSDLAVPCTYRVRGAGGAGYPVQCVVSMRERKGFRPAMGGGGGGGGPVTLSTIHLTLPPAYAGETAQGLVSGDVAPIDDGNGGTMNGIVHLRQGDTLEVPGYTVGRPDVATVVLKVGQDARRVGGAWTCEGNP